MKRVEKLASGSKKLHPTLIRPPSTRTCRDFWVALIHPCRPTMLLTSQKGRGCKRTSIKEKVVNQQCKVAGSSRYDASPWTRPCARTVRAGERGGRSRPLRTGQRIAPANKAVPNVIYCAKSPLLVICPTVTEQKHFTLSMTKNVNSTSRAVRSLKAGAIKCKIPRK